MELVMSFLLMLGGVAVFMHGMKLMSGGLEQSAGTEIRNLFKILNINRFADYGVGILTTILLQSSSATSIMTVGLANAKIVSERQGAGIILGAKVGTTLTALVVAVFSISKGGFSFEIVFASLAFIGVMITISTKNEFWLKIALFLTGFGLLFLGLEIIEISIGGQDSILCRELEKLFNYEVMKNPILLVLLGLIFTCIIQSSTAATLFFLTLLASSVVRVDQSLYLVMGANVGTCSDGLMAGIGSNAHGKRIAIFHLMTSTIGALMFTIVLMIFHDPIIKLLSFIESDLVKLATYNFAYNTIYTLLLLPLIMPLMNLVAKIIREKPEVEHQMKFIDDRLLSTPSIAISQTLKEVEHLGELAKENLVRSFYDLVETNTERSRTIADIEYEIDNNTKALANYIIKISSNNISFADERLLGGLHHVISDIERLGDHAVIFAKETSFMKNHELTFGENTKTEIKEIFKQIEIMYDLCMFTFTKRTTEKLQDISNLHKQIGGMIVAAKDTHTTRLNLGEYTVELSKSLYAVLLSLQRITDHLVNVAFSIKSSTGSKTEAFKVMEAKKTKKSE